MKEDVKEGGGILIQINDAKNTGFLSSGEGLTIDKLMQTVSVITNRTTRNGKLRKMIINAAALWGLNDEDFKAMCLYPNVVTYATFKELEKIEKMMIKLGIKKEAGK